MFNSVNRKVYIMNSFEITFIMGAVLKFTVIKMRFIVTNFVNELFMNSYKL